MDKKGLIDAIDSFKNKKVAVIGDVVLDKYVYGKVERVNPENPGAPVIRIESKDYRLGCAANVALNVSSLGGYGLLCGIVGNDHYGDIFENLCIEKKLEYLLLKDMETIVKERFIESEFNQYLLRADDGESSSYILSEELTDKIYNYLKELDIDAIILSDYNKRLFTNGLGKKIVEFAKYKEIPVVVDPKPANAFSFVGSTLFRPNIKEAREITGLKKENEREVTKKLFEISESKYVAVTCGKKGVICYNGEDFTEIPTRVREVVDVTGAGDTVCSAITLGLISGLSLFDSANLANYAAGVVVEKQGTSTVSREELIKRIEEDYIEKDISQKIKF